MTRRTPPPRRGPSLLASLPLAALAVAAPAAGQADDARDRAVVDALERGEYEQARALLDAILVDRYVAEANELFASGNPQDGLLAVDRAQEIDERAPAALLARARGSALLADELVAAGAGAVHVEAAFRDALNAWSQAPDGPERYFGASRAWLMLGDPERALTLAREGRAKLRAAQGEVSIQPLPDRTWAEAAFAAFRTEATKPQGERDDDTVSALFLESEDAFGGVVGHAYDDPWSWRTFASLYEWGGRPDDALGRLQQGLDYLPANGELHQALDDTARRVGGAARSAAAFATFCERHPDVAEGHWRAGRAALDALIAAGWTAEDAAGRAAAAEAHLARSREVDPSYRESAIGWEVICRAAAGWSHFAAGELDAADAAFRSMDELVSGGLLWRLPGAEGRPDLVRSGDQGLFFVADARARSGDLRTAGETFAFLHEYAPDVVDWANHAGFFLRDAAVELEFAGQALCYAANGAVDDEEQLAALRELAGVPASEHGTDAERARFRDTSDALMREAYAVMERSEQSYEDAVALNPTDVRLLNDQAMILIYYLHRELDHAEAILHRAVRLGEEQLAAGGLDETQRFDVANAWGDAYQNLGVLYLSRDDQPEVARTWFQRSVDIGPNPRPTITGVWLPKCDGTAVDFEESIAVTSWASPCTLR